LLVELVALDDPDGFVAAKAEKVIKFPFHFNLPRPWIGSGKSHAYTWTKHNEAEFLEIRSSILGGAGPDAIGSAEKFIDAHPHAIFWILGSKIVHVLTNKNSRPFVIAYEDGGESISGNPVVTLGSSAARMKIFHTTPKH